MARVARELNLALEDPVYGARYYGCGSKATAQGKVSGYATYDRVSSHANIAAYLLWRYFPLRRSLDVGCAVGFVVEALRELGVDAKGVDVSQYAIDHAADGARGHILRGDLSSGVRFADGHFDVVTALETLEHLQPEAVPQTLRELRRLTSGYAVCTIPSFGPNPAGPGGWFEGKVREDRLEHYKSLGAGYEGPVAYDDLFRDVDGQPVEGHLTIASFSWWTKRFEEAGFVRCVDVERRMLPQIDRFNLVPYWNLYVLRVPAGDEPPEVLRGDAEIADVERRFALDQEEAMAEAARRAT